MRKKTYVIDIDGTICTNTDGDYERAKPYYERIKLINKLYKAGNKIIMFTARGSTTNIDWYEITQKQLKDWGLKYHDLKLKKPFGDFYIDDKAIDDLKFFKEIQNIKHSKKIKSINDNFLVVLQDFYKDLDSQEKLEKVGKEIYKKISKNGKLIICGNGGSMSDALHLSAEFTGRFKRERRSLPSIVLGSNQSSLTAIGNDYGFEEIFSRELDALVNKDDFILLISTSGKSPNIIKCMELAIRKNIKFFFLTSIKADDKVINPELSIKVNSLDTALIQQMHISFGHIICEIVDSYLESN